MKNPDSTQRDSNYPRLAGTQFRCNLDLSDDEPVNHHAERGFSKSFVFEKQDNSVISVCSLPVAGEEAVRSADRPELADRPAALRPVVPPGQAR